MTIRLRVVHVEQALEVTSHPQAELVVMAISRRQSEHHSSYRQKDA